MPVLRWHGLPAEIRTQIWSYLLVSPDSIILNETGSARKDIPTSFATASSYHEGALPLRMVSDANLRYLSLLLVHASETTTIRSLFFGRNTFRLHSSCASALTFLSSLSPLSRLALRRVGISSKALYYYDTANRCFRTLFTYIARELRLDRLEIMTYEGQNGLIDAVFREAAKGVFECQVGELRIRYEITPAYGLDMGDNVLAGRVIWDEWEENFATRYAAGDALEGVVTITGGREVEGGNDGATRGRTGMARLGHAQMSPMLSPYWTRFFKDDEKRTELVKESRSLYPFQLFVQNVIEWEEEHVLLVLKEIDRGVLEARLTEVEQRIMVNSTQPLESEGQTAGNLQAMVDSARRTLIALDERKMKVRADR